MPSPRPCRGLIVLTVVALALVWSLAPEPVAAMLLGALGVTAQPEAFSTGSAGGEAVASVLQAWLPYITLYWLVRRDLGKMEERIHWRFAQHEKRLDDLDADLIRQIEAFRRT